MPHTNSHTEICTPPTSREVADYLQKTTMLNAAKVERILAAVQASLTVTLAKAEAAATSGDFASLTQVSHTLKGTLLQCGLNPWADKAQFIYDAAKQEQDLSFAELLAEIRTAMRHLI